jgi:hypothetical protein
MAWHLRIAHPLVQVAPFARALRGLAGECTAKAVEAPNGGAAD